MLGMIRWCDIRFKRLIVLVFAQLFQKCSELNYVDDGWTSHLLGFRNINNLKCFSITPINYEPVSDTIFTL